MAGEQRSVANLPNALTTLRLLLVPLFGWLLLRDGGQDPASSIGAVVVFVVAMVTDLVDGKLARDRDLVTPFGTIMDPIADKALIGTALIGLSALDQVPWWATAVILVREVGITALRFVVIRHGVMPAGRGGKTKTALQTLTLVLLMLPLPESWSWLTTTLLYATVLVTVVTGLDYLASARRLRATSERTAAKRAARQSRQGGMREAAAEPPAGT